MGWIFACLRGFDCDRTFDYMRIFGCLKTHEEFKKGNLLPSDHLPPPRDIEGLTPGSVDLKMQKFW